MTHETAATRTAFQFHLSTAIALMLTAGVLLWLNLADAIEAVGWPDTFYWLTENKDANFEFRWALYDGIVVVLSLLLVGFVFEARIWGWRAGKIFVWLFIGIALSLQILANLHALMALRS